MSYMVFPAATNPTVALCAMRVAVAFPLPPPPCLHQFLHLAATTRPVQYVIEYVCDDAWQHPQTQKEHSALCRPFGYVVCRVRHRLFRSRFPLRGVHIYRTLQAPTLIEEKSETTHGPSAYKFRTLNKKLKIHVIEVQLV